MDQYKGFDLFNDIEDVALRTRNRAVVLANIAEDNTKNRLISAKGASLILGYFYAVAEDQRKALRDKYAEMMNQRGYATL